MIVPIIEDGAQWNTILPLMNTSSLLISIKMEKVSLDEENQRRVQRTSYHSRTRIGSDLAERLSRSKVCFRSIHIGQHFRVVRKCSVTFCLVIVSAVDRVKLFAARIFRGPHFGHANMITVTHCSGSTIFVTLPTEGQCSILVYTVWSCKN